MPKKGRRNKSCTDTPCIVVVIVLVCLFVFKATPLCSVHCILLQEDELIQALCQEHGPIGGDDVAVPSQQRWGGGGVGA